MKKLLTILIGCSMGLTSGAIAQQEQASQPPKAEHPAKGQHPREKKPAGETNPARETNPAGETNRARETNPETGMKPSHDAKRSRDTNRPADMKLSPERKTMPEPANKNQTEQASPDSRGAAKHSSTSGSSAVTRDQKDAAARSQQTDQMKKQPNAPKDTTNTRTTANPNPANGSVSSPNAMKPNPAPAVTTNSPGSAANPQANRVNPQAKKPDPQVVQKIKTEHANFRAQPRPDKVPSVTFNESHRIEGSDRWQGPQYERFRTYRPEMHDQNWYHSHYQRVEVIGGGAYYWNEGYWYPAWGYNSSEQYYPYDGPIYVGSSAEPPDRVISDVQAILQEEGYYKGEVDGLLGPLTREALTAYQADNGLYTTATIDEPTLASLNLG